MRPTITLRRALADRNLLGDALKGDSWRPLAKGDGQSHVASSSLS